MSYSKESQTTRGSSQQPLSGSILAVTASLSTGAMAGGAFRFDGLGPLALIAWIPLLAAVHNARSSTAIFLGWLAGITSILVATPWVIDTLNRITAATSPQLLLLWLALVAAWSVGLGAWAAITAVALRRSGWVSWAAPALAIAAVEQWVPFVFPIHFGAANCQFPLLLQVAELGGGAAVTALTMLINLGLWMGLRSLREGEAPMRLYCVVAVLLLASAVRMRTVSPSGGSAPGITVGLFQPEFDFETKQSLALTASRRARTLQEGIQGLDDRGVDLILLHEGAWPYPVDRSRRTDFPVGHPWRVLAESPGASVLCGALTTDGSDELFNSVVAYEADGSVAGRYDKEGLFAPGETEVLDRFLSVAGLSREDLVAELPKIRPGDGARSLEVAGVRVAPLVCNEDTRTSNWSATELSRIDLLVGHSSEDWFGDATSGRQQRALATLRAIESRRSFVRVGSQGGTSWIDPAGRIAAEIAEIDTQQNRPRSLVVEIPLLGHASAAPWALPVFPWLLIAGLFACAMRLRFAGSDSRSDVRPTDEIAADGSKEVSGATAALR